MRSGCWSRPLIPPAKRGGRKWGNVREVLNTIFYVLWTGCQWKALPKDFPPRARCIDALGNPVALSLTPGQASDLSQAEPLLDEVEPKAFLADKAYDADALIDTLEQRGIVPVIPSKANRVEPRDTDFDLYRERNLVERFFNKPCPREGGDQTLPRHRHAL